MRSLVLMTAGLLLVSGCGGLADSRAATGAADSPTIDSLDGSRVGELAEKQLELKHPQMAIGRITCPDLVFAVGRSVRCERVAELSGGRRIRVLGTVTVTSVEGGGKLHVELDDDVTEFGIAGTRLVSDLRSALAERQARAVWAHCPYLLGKRGQAVLCRFRLAGAASAKGAGKVGKVRVVVTGVDPDANATRYRFDWPRSAPPAQRSLPFVAIKRPAVVDWSGDDRSRAAA